MENENKDNVIGKLIEHPDISYQLIITQKTNGELQFTLIDHISRTTTNVIESEFSEGNNFVPACKKIIENVKISHRNVTLFDK